MTIAQVSHLRILPCRPLDILAMIFQGVRFLAHAFVTFRPFTTTHLPRHRLWPRCILTTILTHRYIPTHSLPTHLTPTTLGHLRVHMDQTTSRALPFGEAHRLVSVAITAGLFSRHGARHLQ